MLTLDEIQYVASKVEQYAKVLNAPNEHDTIRVHGGRIELIENDVVIISKPISSSRMDLRAIEYRKKCVLFGGRKVQSV